MSWFDVLKWCRNFVPEWLLHNFISNNWCFLWHHSCVTSSFLILMSTFLYRSLMSEFDVIFSCQSFISWFDHIFSCHIFQVLMTSKYDMKKIIELLGCDIQIHTPKKHIKCTTRASDLESCGQHDSRSANTVVIIWGPIWISYFALLFDLFFDVVIWSWNSRALMLNVAVRLLFYFHVKFWCYTLVSLFLYVDVIIWCNESITSSLMS